MYLENRKPPTIIVTPRISDATLAIGAFGLGAKVGVGVETGVVVVSSSKGRTLFVFVLAFVRWMEIGSDFL